jgi:hypothetical protein
MAEKATKLELQLRHGRQFSDSIPQLFQMLENTTFNPAIHLPKSLSALDESKAIIIFLSRYIIAIVRDFAYSPVDYDLILAAYGFLDGYEYSEVQERHIQYCQNVGIHKFGKDTPLNVHWPADDIDKGLNTKENSAIKKLAKRLESEMVKRGGTLGYAAEAEKLLGEPFPFPNYLLGNGYRKCEIENRIFYVPLTERELRSLANQAVKKITSSSFNVDTDSDNLSKDAITKEKDWGKQIAEELAKTRNNLRHTNVILAVLIVVLILFSMIYFWQTKKPSMDDTIPVADSILLPVEAYSDNGLLVEMETFSIDEDDKVIPLAPGYSKGLPIKNPEPSNADISTLKVESSDESIVLWDKDRLYLTALDNIPEGETHKVYVTITAKNHREIICIEVKEFVISDDSEGLVGGGE